MSTTPSDKPKSCVDAKLLPAELEFVTSAESRGVTLHRGGNPDFLAESDGIVFGVEVKRGEDRISPAQSRMFAALERGGIRVYIWNPAMPDALVPWRSYMSLRRTGAARAQANRLYRDARLGELTGLIQTG